MVSINLVADVDFDEF